MEKMFFKYSMENVKLINILLDFYFKFLKSECVYSESDKMMMKYVYYDSIMDSLLYVIMCTSFIITYMVKILSKFMLNRNKFYYFSSTLDCSMFFDKKVDLILDLGDYVNLDYVFNFGNYKFMMRYVFMLMYVVLISSW